MVSDILRILGTAISACFTWFDALISGDLWTLLFSVIAMGLVARFLIVPFFGGRARTGGSDKARKQKGDLNE